MTHEVEEEGHARFWSRSTRLAILALICVGFLGALGQFGNNFLSGSQLLWETQQGPGTQPGHIELIVLFSDVAFVLGLLASGFLVVVAGYLSDHRDKASFLQDALLCALFALSIVLAVILIWGVDFGSRGYLVGQLASFSVLEFATVFVHVAALAVLFCGLEHRHFLLATGIAATSIFFANILFLAAMPLLDPFGFDGGVAFLTSFCVLLSIFTAIAWHRARRAVMKPSLSREKEQIGNASVSVSTIVVAVVTITISGTAGWFGSTLIDSARMFFLSEENWSISGVSSSMLLLVTTASTLATIAFFVFLAAKVSPSRKAIGFLSLVLAVMAVTKLFAADVTNWLMPISAIVATGYVLALMCQAWVLVLAGRKLIGLAIGAFLSGELLVRLAAHEMYLLFEFSDTVLYAGVCGLLVTLALFVLFWRHLLPAQWSKRDIQVYR